MIHEKMFNQKKCLLYCNNLVFCSGINPFYPAYIKNEDTYRVSL